MSAEKVAVYLTKQETQVLRGLIVREAQRLEANKYQRAADEPSALRRLRPVAKKIWAARHYFDEVSNG